MWNGPVDGRGPREAQMSGRDRIGAIVLAAGRSERMGQAKQLLRLQGRSLLAHSLASVLRTEADPVVLVLGFAAEQIRRETPAELLDKVMIVINASHAGGMSSSLRAGLAALGPQADASLIILADQPFVKPETMCAMIQAYRESSADIVVPRYQARRGNPVLLDRAVFPEAMNLKGDMGFRAIFGNHGASLIAVDVDDEGVVVDIDNREDYERARRQKG